MSVKLNIFLVDDHSLFREGLRFLLANSNFVAEIKEAKNGQEFLEGLQNFKPDIILMDIDMPIMNGIEATLQAIKNDSHLKIIALSMYSDENFYTEMIEAGAKGFLLKNSQFIDVETAIKEVYNGRNYFSPEILSLIIRGLNRKTNTPINHELTKRELEVLLNICQGLSNQEISEQLYISKRTVDKHRENILLKTQSKNTAELVVYAIKKGYFEI
ncbi:response regulator transcription factor [Ancylomarina sp. 16SWW S1-10-2]|uniref:response regulator n=1 Tax=Ancylomarina sp. 16SWW S1-10-2 TaxID=2499681 RepID=UPI0012ADAC6E|nr:response regulator transcription factor [Ancylomarina sp. 16SWW S1-10-2]MRT94304.1 response regulator transcription factor [Ancylomarina sp. 16SWW S1-10-2]